MTIMASSDGSLSEDYLLKISQDNSLSEVEELNLCDLGLFEEDFNADVFNKLTNLVEINLSGNQLKCIPNEIVLNNLQYLNMSRNCLTDVEWLSRFPNLKELDVADNTSLTIDDSYKIMYILKKLQFLDGKRIQNNDKIGDKFTIELLKRMENIWFPQFETRWKKESRDGKMVLINEFIAVAQAKVKFGPNSLKVYRNWRINSIAKDFFKSKFNCKNFTFTQLLEDKSKTNTNCIEINKNNTHNQSVRKRSNSVLTANGKISISKKKMKNASINNDQKSLWNFEPLMFLQCHSNCDGPDDFVTQVWCCAFQPNAHKLSKTLATCGGHTVCVINCETGKVESRFEQENEEFYTLSWTSVFLNDHPANLLVAAGCLGFLHLFHVDQSICYGRIKCHSSPIQTVCFLTGSDTRLLSADKRGNVFLIDIDSPLIPEYKFTWKKLMTFPGLNFSPLHFLAKNDYLFCATELGLYFWSAENLLENKIKTVNLLVSPCHQMTFPDVDSNALVDAIDMLSDDIIATKCPQEGVIFLWKYSEFTRQVSSTRPSQKIKIQLLAQLQWSDVVQYYINFTVNLKHNVLLVGDEAGKLLIYDCSSLLHKQDFSCSLMSPDVIIPFPTCTRKDNSQLDSVFKNKVVYNDVACSDDLGYVVVVTDNNLVGIFKKI